MAPRRVRGFSLPELLVSLAIGLLLLAGFLRILDRCRSEYAANESLAALQDSARQALSALVLDLEHAGFYGFTATPDFQLARGGSVIAGADELRQPLEGAVAPVAGLPAGSHACGVNFAVDLARPVQAANNAFPPGIDARDCAPTDTAGGVREGTDSLTVRHAALSAGEPHAGRLQILARRLESLGMATLFGDGRPPGLVDANTEIRDLEVRTYYIANNSVGHPGWPALRMKALTESRGAAQFRDEEIQPGVEDLQVEIGVRDGAGANARIRFVAPDVLEAHTQRVVAVRLWLRIRAELTERGYADTRPLEYADVRFVPNAREAAQRRTLVARTVALRNGA